MLKQHTSRRKQKCYKQNTMSLMLKRRRTKIKEHNQNKALPKTNNA
jgi:hypothetical protein